MGWRLVLLALGLACWILPLVKRTNPPVIMMLIGFVLVLSGEIIGRGIFYGLHMTAGMAYLS